jgi:hypothetical protein
MHCGDLMQGELDSHFAPRGKVDGAGRVSVGRTRIAAFSQHDRVVSTSLIGVRTNNIFTGAEAGEPKLSEIVRSGITECSSGSNEATAPVHHTGDKINHLGVHDRVALIVKHLACDYAGGHQAD